MIDIICCFNDIPIGHNWDGQSGKKKLLRNQPISYVDQFLGLYYSIKKNWKFDYTIYLCHSLPISDESHKKLKNLDVSIVNVQSPDPQNYPYLIRSNSWKLKTKGSHKLYLDIDMLALKNPSFDLEKDFLVMPCNSNQYYQRGNPKSKQKVLDMCNTILKPPAREWNVRENILNDLWAGKLSYEQYITGNFLPHFNGGSILMKNDLSSSFADNWWSNFISMIKTWNRGSKELQPLLYCDGLTILKMSNNWSIFELGFNYFDGARFCVNPKLFDKNKISLYHYVHSHHLYERFGDYFNHIN